MSDYLPAVQRSKSIDAPVASRERTSTSALQSLLGSPIARGVADVLPDVIRLIGRRQPEPRHRSIVSGIVPSSDGASGMSLSEVEVDIDAPFIRRVVIRSASSWSVAPAVIEHHQQSRRGRIKLGALTLGILGVASVVVARRLGISLPVDRLLPVRAGHLANGTNIRERPGLAD